jgi:hypothetical protein
MEETENLLCSVWNASLCHYEISNLSLDKPLHVIYKVSKLAYRIWVILIANERVKKKSTAKKITNFVCPIVYLNHN